MEAIRCRWKGRSLVPDGNFAMAAACDLMAEGDVVLVEIDHPRSPSTHKHQFAWIKDAWANLPESVMFEEWAATPETLRKRALIECGFFEQVVIDCGEASAAKAAAKAVKEARHKAHGYALSVVRGPVAVIRWPESQSVSAMGGKRFQESKSKILEWIAAQIGVTPEELRKAS